MSIWHIPFIFKNHYFDFRLGYIYLPRIAIRSDNLILKIKQMETKTINIKELKESFYNKLKDDKIKINWNKNPIRMDLFISFLNVELIRSNDHLGSNNGWTKLQNDSIKLYIGGGIVNGVEYLDTLKYGEKLSNGYNNFVNPFYLFEIMNTDGQKFFIDYYKEDIDKIVKSFEDKKANAEWNLIQARKELIDIKSEVEFLTT